MEGLGVGLSPVIALTNTHKEQSLKLLGSTRSFSSPKIPSFRFKTQQNFPSAMRMQVVEEEYEVKQAKDMAAARKIWDAMAWVKGSTWMPIFDVDTGFDASALSRGWWSGVLALSYDKNFLPKVEEKFSKDTDLIVSCQKGLRSLAACEFLYNAGNENLYWVQGGLEAVEVEDFGREGSQPLFAGIGGVSELLGWTDQQHAATAQEVLRYRLVFTAVLLGVILVSDALFLGAQQVGRYIQDLGFQ